MDDSYQIRAAEPSDVDWLVACNIAMAWETEGKRLEPAIVRAGVAAGVADPAKARYFVATRHAPIVADDDFDVPVGTLMLTSEWSDWRNGDWWWIQSVYVPPPHRRQGVYAALYRHVERLARADPGVIGLRLYVEKDNAVAQRTYESLGMSDSGYRLYQDWFG